MSINFPWASPAIGISVTAMLLSIMVYYIFAIRNPRIFVLDEATSSIDTRTEALIQEAISTLLTGRTSFLIAHRLSTIRKADMILVVRGGKIIEQGTHRQLMEQGGYYADLYHKQFETETTESLLAE